MTRVYAILAHPKKDSLSGHIFYTVVKHLRDHGIFVDVLDLYDHKEQIPFYIPSLSQNIDQYPFAQQNKDRFMAADRLFIVYPIYWYAVPGIMKCWLDLITNYAWNFDKGPYGIPLHHITKALVVNSAGMSNLFRWFRTKNSGTEMLKDSFKFLGINRYDFYEIGNSGHLTTKKLENHFAKIIKKSNKLVQN